MLSTAVERDLSNPAFSIVLPTIGRSKLFDEAIQSVLGQSFSDFELIISDNSGNSGLRETVGKYSADKRLRYIHSQYQLAMPDHWEFATRHTVGQYVLILTDREVMRPDALAFLHRTIQEFPGHNEVVFWYEDTAYSSPGILNPGEFTGSSKLWESKQLAEAFARFDVSLSHLPQAVNSCYRADVAERIRNRHGRMFFPLSPDYTSAFLLFAYTDDMVYIDLPLSFLCDSTTANHAGLLRGRQKEYLSTLSREPFLETPFALGTITNYIVDDLLTIQKMVGDRLSNVRLDIEQYLLANYREIVQLEGAGASLDVAAMYDEWWGFVNNLSKEQRARLALKVKDLNKNRRPRLGKIRKLSFQLGIWPYLSVLRGRIRRLRRRFAGQPVYSSALDAARKTNSVLTVPSPIACLDTAAQLGVSQTVLGRAP